MPTCGVRGIWASDAEDYFFKASIVIELTRVGALTLYSFWEQNEERWMNRLELETGGLDAEYAECVANYLASSLRGQVSAAMGIKWATQKGNWCVDRWGTGEDAFYDSVLRITEIKEGADVVTGMEYVLPSDEALESRLHLDWNPEGGGSVTGVLEKSEMLTLRRETLHPIVTLKPERKEMWKQNSSRMKPESDRNSPEEWWLPVGCPVKEMIFNPAMWQLRASPQADSGKPMLECPSAHLGKLLRKDRQTRQGLRDVWQRTDEKAREILRTIWRAELAPKLRSFLWLVVHRALPTWERRSEWMLRQGMAVCAVHCTGVPNTAIHVLAMCRRVEPIWCAYAEWLTENLGVRIVLSARFVLLDVAECAMEEQLAKGAWWRTVQAWTLYQIWVGRTSSTFGGKRYLSAVRVASKAWQKAMQALRAHRQTRKIDPVKGPPKLRKDVSKLEWRCRRKTGWFGVIRCRRVWPQQ